MKSNFKLTAVAMALAALSGNVFADQNITDIDNINIIVDDNNGSAGALNVYKGALGNTATELLATFDNNANGGARINTNMTVTGNVNATDVTTNVITLAGQDLSTLITDGDAATLASANTNAAAGDAATLASANTNSAAGDAVIRGDIANKVITNGLEVNGDALVTGILTATSVNIVNTSSVGVPSTATATSGISTTQKYNAGTITGIADDVYKITEQDPISGALTDKYYTRDAITGNYAKVVLSPSQTAALPFTGNKTGPTTNVTTTQDVNLNQSVINGQKVDFSNSKTRDTTVDIKGQLVQIDANGNPVGVPESANGQALSNQIDLEKNRAAIGVLDRDGNPLTADDFYGVNTVKTVYDAVTDTRTSGDTTIEGDSIVLTSTTEVAGVKTSDKTTAINAEGITTSRINGNGANGALVLHGGTNSTTQTLDDNGVLFVTTDVNNNVTGTTRIDANGTLTVKGVDVTTAINNNATAIAQEVVDRTAGDVTLQTNIDAEAVTRAADDVTLQNNIDAEAVTRAAGDAATLASANTNAAAGDAATLASANATTATTATTLRGEAATEAVRVNQAIADGDAVTLSSAKSNAAAGDAATLASANATTATTATMLRTEMATGNASTLSSANSYTDGRVNQVSRKLDNVERTAYRGVAIALAAQQAVPNIQPGQVAVFGGVGHYEGETAGSIGVVTSFTNRISASGAFGFAGSNSFGGRVGISYLFGGN